MLHVPASGSIVTLSASSVELPEPPPLAVTVNNSVPLPPRPSEFRHLNIEVGNVCCVGDGDVRTEFCAVDESGGVDCHAAGVCSACDEPLCLRTVFESFAGDFYVEIDRALLGHRRIGGVDLDLALRG